MYVAYFCNPITVHSYVIMVSQECPSEMRPHFTDAGNPILHLKDLVLAKRKLFGRLFINSLLLCPGHYSYRHMSFVGLQIDIYGEHQTFQSNSALCLL